MSALDWMVIHECDDEEKPMQWAAEIHHPEYGKWCWISNTGDHFIVEVVEESNGVPTYIEASSWCPMASIGDVFESAKFSITITD